MSGRQCDVNGSSILVYELDEQQHLISFEEFYLIVRSLHSYRVIEIIKREAERKIIVKLGYIASLKNVRAKTGTVPCTVTKLNPNVGLSELDELAQLRSRFGFGQAEEEEITAPKPAKKPRYKESD